jgi:hypothetical protein
MGPRLGRVPLLVAALTPASLVLVHDLSFLAAYGAQYRAALLASGHDERWTSTVTAVVIVSLVLGAVGVARLGFLWVRARSLDEAVEGRRTTDVVGFGRLLACLWPALAVVTASLFLVQENLERAALGAPLAGLEPLLAAAPFLILLVVSFLLAALGALLLWGHEVLLARIAAALRGRRPVSRPQGLRRPSTPALPTSSLLSLNLGRRAPPARLA